MSNIAASIITIGDELLIGQTIDTNSAWIAKGLNELGIDVLRRVAVGDSKQAIIDALDEELAKSQVVIITGGLGPTADDITKPLLLEYFGGTMRVDEGVLAHVQHLFARLGRPVLGRNLKQAEVPDTCKVLFNRMGTAPGMWFERDDKVVVALPGVPHEMAGIMTDEVLPGLRSRFSGDAIIHHSIVTAGEGESVIADKIQDIEESLPAHIRLAYLPGARMVKLRLTGKGSLADELTKQLLHFQGLIAERLGEIIVSLEDVPMEQILHEWFTKNGATLGLAESCTGGFLSHQLTQVPGSSGYFKGAIVCYNNQVKEDLLGVNPETILTHGVVSEACAVEMAVGARKTLKSDYALSITGLLGPASSSDREVPGTIWMAIADKDRVHSKKFLVHYDRHRNKEVSISMAMLMIFKFINSAG